MSAAADDLRYFYAENLGDAEIKSADGTGIEFKDLVPGRYAVRYRTVAGSTVVWVKQTEQGDTTLLNVAPATPFDIATNGLLFTFMVRGVSPSAQQANVTKPRNRLTFRTNAGTVDIVVTRISREA